MTTTVPASMLAADAATQAELDAVNTALGARVTTLEGLATTSGVLVATTSGTSIDFTGIPATAKRVTLVLNGVSLSATANLQVQVGNGAVVTTGYVGGVSQSGATPNNGTLTTGLGVTVTNTAASTHSGTVTFTNLSGNTWVGVALTQRSDGYGQQGGATVTLSGALDRIRLTSTGADTFDAGSVNVMWQ